MAKVDKLKREKAKLKVKCFFSLVVHLHVATSKLPQETK